MTPAQAKAAMRKLLGEKAGWEYREKAPNGDEREEIRASLAALGQEAVKAKEAATARRMELLQDPEYQRLFALSNDARKAHESAMSRERSYRVTIGRRNGIFFEVLAEGDNWQDGIDKLRKRVGKQAA